LLAYGQLKDLLSDESLWFEWVAVVDGVEEFEKNQEMDLHFELKVDKNTYIYRIHLWISLIVASFIAKQ